MSEYVLFFMPGSQGRFLASVLWALLNDKFVTNNPDTLNSWHNENFWDYPCTVTNLDYYTDVNFYYNLVWNHRNNLALYRSHHYPDWKTLASSDKFNNSKFIVIQVDETDLKECLANEMYKNGYKRIKEKALDDTVNDLSCKNLYAMYQDQVDTIDYKDFVNLIDKDIMQEFIKKSFFGYIDRLRQQKHPEDRINFIFTEIPDYIKHRTLIINFKDLYTKSSNGWVALDKLILFTNITPSPDVLDNICYNFNVNSEGRKDVVRNYMYKLDIIL